MSDPPRTDVYTAFRLITRHLGATFPLERLLDFIAVCRGKGMVRVEEQVLPIEKSGYCFAFQDVDLIVIRSGLHADRWLHACLHECAHFLLRHIPRVSAGATTPTFDEFVDSTDLRQAVYRSQVLAGDHSTAYDTPDEWTAETLATLLLPCIQPRGDDDMPPSARDLYGDD